MKIKNNTGVWNKTELSRIWKKYFLDPFLLNLKISQASWERISSLKMILITRNHKNSQIYIFLLINKSDNSSTKMSSSELLRLRVLLPSLHFHLQIFVFLESSDQSLIGFMYFPLIYSSLWVRSLLKIFEDSIYGFYFNMYYYVLLYYVVLVM